VFVRACGYFTLVMFVDFWVFAVRYFCNSGFGFVVPVFWASTMFVPVTVIEDIKTFFPVYLLLSASDSTPITLPTLQKPAPPYGLSRSSNHPFPHDGGESPSS
jgi:hypothetical protein